MSENTVDPRLPPDFNGIVRLFPLPNLVLFPGVIQALHLFEMRYRKLMEDALAGDELITMGLFKGDGRQSVEESPEIHSIVCIGKIVTHARLDDGRFNLLLIGASRARIIAEIATELPYRMAEVELLSDSCDESADHVRSLRQRLISEFRSCTEKQNQRQAKTIENLLGDDVPFGMLIDLICFSTGARPAVQQTVLETQDLVQRAEMTLEILRNLDAAGSDHSDQSGGSDRGTDFLPDFSSN